jgi:hypothetical protein
MFLRASPASCVGWSISSIRKRARRPAETASRPILPELTDGAWDSGVAGSRGPRHGPIAGPALAL